MIWHLGRRPDRPAADHARARELAATRLADPLAASDAAWLAAHLEHCDDCRGIAAAYAEQRTVLRVLRDSAPLPPRDLWARTAAAIEGSGARLTRRASGSPWSRRPSLAPVAALLVAAVAGAGLLDAAGLLPGSASPTGSSGPVPTPIAMAAGEVQFVTRGDGGVLELSTRHYDEVCPVGAAVCGTSASTDTVGLPADLAGLGSFDAYISPTQDHIVVMGKGTSGGGVYVVPVQAPQTPTASTAPPSPAETLGPSARVSPVPTVRPTSSPVAPTRTPEPTPVPGATGTPVTSPHPTTPLPSVTVAPSQPPASPPAASSSPAEGTPPPDASASPAVDVTPAPDGTLQIARGVIVVGSVSAYSADGARFAFSARPADGSAGPDVYVWQTSDTEARPMTTDHGSVFAGWQGDQLLVSRVVDGMPVTVLLDPATGLEQPVPAQRMWLPTVGPAQLRGVWWDGTLQPTADGFSWQPGDGQLVLGAWPDGHGTQVLATGPMHSWEVRWDESGSTLALWVSDGVDAPAGRLSLYLVDPQTGIVNLDQPLLSGALAYEGFSLRAGRLVWTVPAPGTSGDQASSSPAPGGDQASISPAPSGDGAGTTIEVLVWSGDTVGHLVLPAGDGAAVVR